MRRLLFYLKYDWPLHFIMFITSWFPNNVIFYRIRGFLACPFFGSCGKHLSLGRNITFYNASNIYLGQYVYMAHGCVIFSLGNIFIEDEVMLAPYVVISSGNHKKKMGHFDLVLLNPLQ